MMAELDRLQQWFDAGYLIRPSADVPHFVNLIRAMLRLAGSEAVPVGPGEDVLAKRIDAAEHYVFVLVDGMGADQIRRLPPNAFLRAHQTDQLQATFLSTTAVALTTVNTGQWPCSHGVTGWWSYLDQFDISAVTLRFQQRGTNRPLSQFGVSPGDLFSVPSLWPTLKHQTLSVLPAEYLGSVYTNYTTGGTSCVGYSSLPQALGIVRKAVLNAQQPTFTYLYLPQLDELSPQKGPDNEHVSNLLRVLDVALTGLAEALSERARIIISADHGQGTVPAERRFVLTQDDPLRAHLRCQPTGEPTVPFFHVRPGEEGAFVSQFTQRFGEHFALLTAQQVEDLRLLGPEPLCDRTRRRLGTFVGIAHKPVFFVEPTDGHPEYVGVHGGLTPEEMTVPLIIV